MDEMKEDLIAALKDRWEDLLTLVKWAILAVLLGLGVGLVGVGFHLAVDWASQTRQAHPWLLFLLPEAGLVIVWLYHRAGIWQDGGTDLVLRAVRGEAPVAFRTAPLIFAASTLTHLCGGSSGREGAALQLGGSIASSLGRRLGFDQDDRRMLVVCGMAAAFSALFGTPLAAALFALEVVHVGVMHYAALVPAVLSSLIAALLAQRLGLHATAYAVADRKSVV